jgi:hypothetical protein
MGKEGWNYICMEGWEKDGMMDESTVVNSQIFKFLLRTDKLSLTGNKHSIVFVQGGVELYL